MSKIIAVGNQKGGVGKSTSTMNIGVELYRRGYKVLCVDMDHQANLSDYLGHEPDKGITITDLMIAAVQNPQNLGDLIPNAIRVAKEGVSYIPADIKLSTVEMYLAQAMFRERALNSILTHPAMPDFDYILIDCLPSLGILVTNALIACDYLLVPVQAQKFALDGLDGLLALAKQVKTQANSKMELCGILITMRDNTKMAGYVSKELRSQFKETVFRTEISRLSEATNSSAMRQSLVSMKGSRLGQQYRAVVDELLERGV